MSELNQELIEIEQERDGLHREVEVLEEALEQERLESVKLKMLVSEEQTKTLNLQDSNRRLEAEIRDYKTQLSAQKGRQQRQITYDANNDPNTTISKKNQEIVKLTGEIQMLSTENASLANELEAVTEELEVAVSELENNNFELTNLRSINDESSQKIDSLLLERDSFRVKVEDLQAEQDEKIDYHVKKLEKVEKLYKESKTINDNLNGKIKGLESRITIQRKEIQALRDKLACDDIEDLKKDIAEKDALIKSLELKVSAAESDLQLLAIDWDRLDQIVQTGAANASIKEITNETNSLKKLKSMIAAYKKRHQGDLEKLKDLSEAQVLKEEQIMELSAKVEKFESGKFGISEAIKESKDLKLQLKIDDREIRRLTKKVNDLEAQAGDLAEENIVLRDQLGINENSPIDTTNLKVGHAIEIERLKSLNSTLTSEIEKLEEQRIDLLKKIRLQAMEVNFK